MVHISTDQTELRVPDGFLRPGTLYEVEVLAIEDSGKPDHLARVLHDQRGLTA